MPLWETREVINRCIFSSDDIQDELLGSLEDNAFIRNFLSDLIVTRDAIFGCGFVAAILCASAEPEPYPYP